MRWTQSEVDYLVKNYPNKVTSELCEHLGRTAKQIYNKANWLGLKKSEGMYAKITRQRWRDGVMTNCLKSTFKKGMKPMNKGVPQSEWMSESAIKNTKKTRFKKGQLPHNYKPVGSERICKDGYIEVKVSDPNKWMHKHRVIWESANGKVPKGMMIKFKDGNRENIVLDNLYLESRAKNMAENSIHRYPNEVLQLIKTTNKLERKIKSYEEQAAGR